jgi:hypothetical protein
MPSAADVGAAAATSFIAGAGALTGPAAPLTIGTAAAAATGDFAAASHAHGNLTSAGAIGSTANLPVITTTSGVLTAGAFGTGATNFCAGNDARLSDARTPAAHNQAETTITFTDVATGNASTTAHGFSPKATAPAAGLVSVLAIGNGETVRSDKALFDTTNPAALGSVGPGTAVIAARRDHVHAMPSAANVGAAAATSFIAGAGALTGPAAPLTIGTAAAAATGDFAPAAKGVTNGDSHDHNGGDGAQIAYSALSGTPIVGKLRQVVVGTYSTVMEFSSATFATINLAASITPTSSSSKILIKVEVPYRQEAEGNDTNFGLKIRRDSTDLLTQSVYAFSIDPVSAEIRMNQMAHATHLDSPNSTSAISYNVQAIADGVVTSFYPNSLVGTIVLMEISA